ncbi:MAG: glycosyltransferase family 4 protein [Acidobacteriota bacterium]
MIRKPLLGYLVSHPIQYQAPLFRRLAASDKIDFVALFGSDFGLQPSYDSQFGCVVDFGIDLLSGYQSIFINQASRQPAIDRFFGLRTPSIHTALKAKPLDVLILHGWRTAMMWQAALGAILRGIPYLMRAETPEFRSNRSPMRLQQQIRNFAVKSLVRRAAGLLALGAANERFYLRMGCAPERMFRVPYFVDNTAVATAAATGRANRREIRATLGIPNDKFVVVAVAKLIQRKRPLDLVQALKALPADIHLVWVGTGPLEEQLRAEAKVLNVEDRLHLAGFRPARETWTILGASDLFALPSQNEPWGLVINEAVAAGLPALVTDQCGGAEDLVVPDRTGEIVNTGDIAAWINAIRKWYQRYQAKDILDQQEIRRRADLHCIEQAALSLENITLAVNDQGGTAK